MIHLTRQISASSGSEYGAVPVVAKVAAQSCVGNTDVVLLTCPLVQFEVQEHKFLRHFLSAQVHVWNVLAPTVSESGSCGVCWLLLCVSPAPVECAGESGSCGVFWLLLCLSPAPVERAGSYCV